MNSSRKSFPINLVALMAAICWALWALWLCNRLAVAHAEYDHSDPAADATVNTAPTQVRIWFTEELFRRQGQNGIEVHNEAGERVDLDDATIDDDDRTLMTISLAADLADGRYQVHWRTTSADDGHEGQGDFAFTVATGGGAENSRSNAMTETNIITETSIITETDAISTTENEANDPGEAAATLTPTGTPAATASPSSSQSAWPCTGGALPLVLVLGAVWMRHWRFSFPSS